MHRNRIFFYSILFLVVCCKHHQNTEEIACENHSQTHIQYELTAASYILHDVSEFYFVSHLGTLTYHQGYYYNLDKEKKLIYQFNFSPRSKDTIDVFINRKMKFDLRTRDFCFEGGDMYILFEQPFSKLVKFPDVLSSTTDNFQSKDGELIADSMNILPYSRIKINNNHYMTGRFSPEVFDLSNPNQEYFEEYDVSNRKIISKFCNVYTVDKQNYFPSMNIPFRLDIDSFSYVSSGIKNTIEVYNNLTGSEKGSHCAKSEYVTKQKGLIQGDAWDFQVEYNWLIGNAYYMELLFDNSHNYFYRVAKHQQDIKDKATLKMNKIENASWSIVVLDNNLNYVDEISFPAKKMNFLKHFSNAEGIHFLSMDLIGNSTDSIIQFKKLRVL